MNRVETNGVELACEAFGAPSDQTILLVAGLGTQMIRWTAPFCLALAARGYHVIRFDNRDAGYSTHISHRAAPDFGELAAALVADAQRRGDLLIRPERLLSVAEVLEPEDRIRLETTFDVPVHQVYQCTEGLLAATCPAGHLHVQEDLVALQYEPLADTARVTPVVTDLWRRTQPIIRYRLGDVLRLADPGAPACSCGSAFQVIEAIEGRCDDVFWFCADSSLRPFFPDTIRRMVLLAEAPVLDYAAEQERPGHLRLFLETPEDISFDAVEAAVRESAARTVAQYGCRPADIAIERGVPVAATGAKRRRVRRLWEGPPA